ncbi:Cytosolic purine 5'-nucleotidase [Camellia lanceoleosa]|uniref:Cytosolic purine 5'-nucleotidase n=1 Tax=Camellia lanceoleosa TaxID=1840588 RepID=A0ACC0HIH5_9ERIC|nr:Cytosolic purine 5'-nucleotidase [Camellia lanceoleosa]
MVEEEEEEEEELEGAIKMGRGGGGGGQRRRRAMAGLGRRPAAATIGLLLLLLHFPEGANHLQASYTMDGTGVDGKTSQFQSMTFSDGGQDPCIWSSGRGGCKINIGKQIFCNRSLNMKNIVAVGFDMDYTLAQYKPETFESLAYEGTVRKLVYDLKYPPEMDRHEYVKVAYHGFRELSKEDKVATYGITLIRDTFDEPNYALIDTLFSLAEAYLFAQLVDFKDNNPGKFPEDADYSFMYRDVRAAVDLCHRDGTLKQMVAEDPKRYINEDTLIVPMIKILWDYTSTVMNFLCGPQTLGSGSTSNFEWLRYFDVVITGSAKPSFFHDENRANHFEVEPESGMLLNTDNGTPMPQVGGTSMLPLKSLNKNCRVFQGGTVGHLHKLLGIGSSSQVLYVGDHIYGDILRSQKVLGWRTMLVVPELEKEVELLWELKDTHKQLQLSRNERDLVEDKIHHLKWSLKFEGLNDDEEKKLSCKLDKLESQREQVLLSHQRAQWRDLHASILYSPNKHYRPSEDFMPHEFDILGM